MAEAAIVSAVGASIVHHALRKLRSITGISTTSFKDIHKALNDGLEWLVSLQRDTDREVSRDVLKDPTNVYLLWADSVSNIEKEVTSLNEKYDKLMRKKWKIWKKRRLKKKNKRVLKKVIKLVEECPEKILEDKPERVIKESGVPSFEEYPTLKKALKEIQDLLQSKAVKCVALHGQEGVGETIVLQNLNDYFYDSPDDKEFDVVIFIKVPTDEKTDLQILQKIAERIKVDGEGDESEVSGRIRRVLEDRRYLLILDGVRHPPNGIWEKLDISSHKKDSKVVIATHYPLALKSICVDRKVELEPLSPDEVWKMFRDTVGDKTSELASPREGESSSKFTTAVGKLDQLVQYMLSLMRIWSSSHLILSYTLRIGHEEFLKQWINDVYKLCFADGDGGANIDSLRTRVRHLISESPLRYVQAVIPEDITKDIINGGSVSRETPFEDVPGPIQFLANHLALHQLTHTLTSRTIPHSRLALDKIQNIWFSTSDDAEKQTVVKNIQENSRIRSAFDHLQIIDLSQIGDETQRELELSSLKTRLDQTTRAESPANHERRSRHLVLVVDGNVDKKLDPLKLSLPIKRDSEDVAVFITTLSSDDELRKKVDLTIKTEDHLLPWELFCNIVGSEILHSSSAIHEIAVQIVEKCGGQLLAIILMAKSLKDEKDVQIWKLALQKLRYVDREAIVNAFFDIIWENIDSERKKILLIRCLMVFRFQDLMMSDDQLFARWFSEKLVDTEEEAKRILQNFVECCVLLQFEGPLGRYILLPEDIKIILHALREEIPDNLNEETSASTISNHRVLKLSNTHMRNLYAVSTLPQLKELNLEGCMLETLPEAVFNLKKLESLSLEHCSQLLELSNQITNLENLKELRLAGCEQLEKLPQEIWELHKLEILSLEQCWRLPKLPQEIAKLQNLKELRLAGCEQLKTLPQEIWELHKLETLSLEQCWQLLKLSPDIDKLKNLKELRLARCKRLKTLPQNIRELQKLETLTLEHCSQLQELPPQITEFENLRELRFAGCKLLKTLPQKIWELKNLEIFSLAGTSIFPTSENRLAGTSIFTTSEERELINSDNYSPPSSSGYHEHSGYGKKAIPSSSSEISQIDFTLKLKVDGGLKQLCQRIMQLQIQNLEICDLSDTHVTDLPQVLNFPNLKSLLLGNNPNLIKIPSSFFNHVPLLSVLNLSSTSIHELPSSIFNLQELKEFYLKDCKLLRELPSEISRLRNLTTLDLDGTLITHLPKEIQWLSNLESLSLSFYNDTVREVKSFISLTDTNHHSNFEVIPVGVLPQLTNLKVLKIGVNSDNEWWSKNFEYILEQIYELGTLRELDLYIPGANSLTLTKMDLSKFRFIIGHHKPKLISRVPSGIQEMFKKSGRSLKFVKGEDFPHQVKSILSKVRAFFLDRHMTINNLSQFGLKNLKQVQLCILAECNEMQSIVDVDEYEAASVLDESLCMEILTIFYMKNLRSVINKPIHGNSMFCELKVLALHTCPELTTIFTMHSVHSLVNLEELIVADCPKVSSIISCPSSEPTTNFFLPRLRKLSLLFVPELSSISNGVCIGRNLEEVGLYHCPKLQSLSTAELSSEKLKVIRGEWEWWADLQWSEVEWGQQDRPHKFNEIFSTIDKNLDIFTQLTTYELASFNKENDSE